MSDAINQPTSPQPAGEQAPIDYSWADEWLHENNDGHLAFRKDGLDALKAHRAGEAQPLQNDVAEVVVGEIDAANEDYTKILGEPMYTAGPETDKVLAEKIGLDLQAIGSGDVRPALRHLVSPDNDNVPKQPEEGEK